MLLLDSPCSIPLVSQTSPMLSWSDISKPSRRQSPLSIWFSPPCPQLEPGWPHRCPQWHHFLSHDCLGQGEVRGAPPAASLLLPDFAVPVSLLQRPIATSVVVVIDHECSKYHQITYIKTTIVIGLRKKNPCSPCEDPCSGSDSAWNALPQGSAWPALPCSGPCSHVVPKRPSLMPVSDVTCSSPLHTQERILAHLSRPSLTATSDTKWTWLPLPPAPMALHGARAHRQARLPFLMADGHASSRGPGPRPTPWHMADAQDSLPLFGESGLLPRKGTTVREGVVAPCDEGPLSLRDRVRLRC